jgi:hypothetical protein
MRPASLLERGFFVRGPEDFLKEYPDFFPIKIFMGKKHIFCMTLQVLQTWPTPFSDFSCSLVSLFIPVH